MSLTAAQIVPAVVSQSWLRHFVLAPYTPAGWWECDVYEVTAAGYWREYEVKVSRGDFVRDARKVKRPWKGQPETKHGLLAVGSPRGPSRFSFVTPAGLVEPGELPEWAGLVEAHQSKYGRVHLVTVVEAPRLHLGKADPKAVEHARAMCYYRMHRNARVEQVEHLEAGAGI